MKYMGIDYGTKRVGVALSDDGGTMAFPHTVLQTNDDLVAELTNIIEDNSVGEVVIGHSLDRESEPNALHAAVESLMGDLTLQVGVPIHLQPEQYTTQEALRIQGRTDKTDAAAAAIILNAFLMKQTP